MAKIPIEITSESDDAQRDLKALEQSLSGLEQAGQEAQTGLDGVGKAGDEAARGTEAAGDGAEQAGESFKVAGLSLTDLKSGLDMAGQALQKVGQAYDATVGAVLAYSDQVRDLARISGASTEETSRLIQASDDLQVEYSTLEQAAKALAKDGIALTTEELAKASDEYLAIEDAGGRAEYATTKFGRAGLELTKVLETGGAALREMAAATDENLVMTEAQVKAARELEIQLDTLEDSVMGVKLAVGNQLIPALIDAIEKMMAFGGAIKKTLTVNEDIQKVYQLHAAEVKKTAKTYGEFTEEMTRSAKAAGYTIEANGEVTRSVRMADGSVRQLSVGVNILTDYWEGMSDEGTRAAAAARNLARDTAAAGVAHVQAAPDVDTLTQALENETGAYMDTGSAAREQVKALDALKVAMNITASAAAFNQSQADMQGKINGTKQLVDDLSKLKYRTPEQEAQLSDLRQQLRNQELALQDLERTHKKATDSMIFNMMLTKAASDGLTAVELENLLKIGRAMGLVDEKTYAMAQQLNAIDLSKPIGEMSEFEAMMAKIYGRSDKTITITTRFVKIGDDIGDPGVPVPGPEGWGNEGNKDGTKLAGGGSYVIPPGRNEDWPVGPGVFAGSGETVTVTPKGESPSAPMGGDKAVLDVLTSILDAINKLDRPAAAPMQVSISGYMGDAASLVAEFERQQQINAMMR